MGAMVVMLAVLATTASAAVTYTGPSPGVWHNASHWDSSAVPDSSSDILITGGQDVVVEEEPQFNDLRVRKGSITFKEYVTSERGTLFAGGPDEVEIVAEDAMNLGDRGSLFISAAG